MAENKDKEKILKAVREKRNITNRETNTGITADFFYQKLYKTKENRTC